MNLTSLKDEILARTDYKPSNPAYRNDLDRIINQAYLTVWNARPWNFAHKQAYLEIQPDITPERCAEENGNSHAVELIPVAGGIAAEFDSPVNRLTNHPELWIGNPIEVDGIEYTIIKAEFFSGDAARIFVDQPFRSSTPTTDWRIRQRFLALPSDCQEIMSLAYRPWPIAAAAQWRPLESVNPYTDARLAGYASLNESGDANFYVREPDFTIPAGGKITYSTTTNDASGNFERGDAFELAWAYVGPFGKIGPLGEATTVTMPTTAHATQNYFTVTLKHFDDSLAASPAYSNPEAYHQPDQDLTYGKALFYNANWDWTTKKRLGPPKWVPVSYGAESQINLPSSSTYARWLATSAMLQVGLLRPDISSVSIRNKTLLKNQYSIRFELFEQPTHKKIRLYPHPDSWDAELEAVGHPETWSLSTNSTSLPLDYVQRVCLTYRFVPPLMAFQTDAPQVPFEFHQAILFCALSEVCAKNNDFASAQNFERKYIDHIKDMTKRYVQYKDVKHGKGNIDSPGWLSFPLGPVVYTG